MEEDDDEQQMMAWLDDYQTETTATLRKSRTYPNVGRKLVYKVNAHTTNTPSILMPL